IMMELYLERTPTLRDRAKIGCIPLNFGRWYERLDRRQAVFSRSHPLELAAFPVQIGHHVAHIGLGDRHSQELHRLKEDRFRLERTLLEGLRGGDLERHFRRVDGM